MSKCRVYARARFLKWANVCGVCNVDLANAVDEMQRGLIDADLGGNLYKKRIPLSGRGKRGGARLIIATRLKDRWIFLEGFAKNERENITRVELAYMRHLAADLLAYSQAQIDLAVQSGVLSEVKIDE